MPDVFKGEPRNIGVIVRGQIKSAARFVGEQDGKFDGRRVRGLVASPEVLKAWINYIRHHMDGDSVERALTSLRRRSLDNYIIEARGPLIEVKTSSDVEQAVDALFAEMVSVSTPATLSLDDRVRRLLFEELPVPSGKSFEENVTYPVTLRGEVRDLHFDYRYVNGKTTLLDKVSFQGQPRLIERRVNDLLFRMEHVGSEVRSTDFITFYDWPPEDLDTDVERHLRTINKYSYTVDVSAKNVVNDVGNQLGIPVLPSS